MSTINEDLLMEMQKVGTQMKRARMKLHMASAPAHEGGPEGHHGHGQGEGHDAHHAHHGHHGHGHCPHAGHGHGKCKHRGSGKHGQARILALLEVQDGMSQKDLAFLLGIRPQSLTLALERLEVEGLIERKQDEDDKRARRVFITEAGKAKAVEQASVRAQEAELVFAVLSDEEKEQLSAILGKLSASMEDAHFHGDAAHEQA